MQPPPRKVKPSVQLKTVHVEQLNKLQQKYQQELDILEDIRLFTKQRSTIEKEYAQALSKLATQYLSKRDFGETPKIESEDGKPHRTLLEAWKSVLEESDRTAKVRVQAAETLLQRIYEPAKTVKTNKSQTAKKVFEHTASLHKEVAMSISEMTKSQKIYNEEEHLAHEARSKASEANEKIRNRSTGIFTSMASLQKTSAKLNSRKESCEIKATASRNDYLLMLTAANAHQTRYYDTDLPDIMQVLDGETFDRIQEFFTTLGKTELDCAKTTLESFSKVLSDADLMSRNYNLQVFLHKNLVFTNKLQYNFEPMDGDPNSSVCNDATASLQLEKEARKWATRIAKEGRVIRDSQKVIQNLTSHESNGRKPSDSSDSQSPPLLEQEQKIEEAKQNLRKAETAKCKAEARIEVLREAGVDVEQWLSSAQAECLAAEEEEIKRTNSSVSIKTASSGRGSTMDEPDNVPSSSPPMESTYINYEEDDFIDDHFDISAQNVAMDTSSTGYSSGRNFPLDCVAIYDFQATNPDELSMVENENLTLIADGDGDGWVRAKNASGDMGFIPENYIQVVGEENAMNGPTQDPNEMNVDGDMPVTSPGEGVSQISGERTSAYSATDYEVEQALQSPTADTMPEVKDGTWARALYDYEANTKEELSFQEGQLIRILRKDENGVDDGWWEGELNGTVGVFPSLVVEELTSQGQPADGDQTISDAIGQQQELYGINLPESYDLEPDMTLTSPGFVNDPDCVEHGVANVSAV